MMTSDYDDVVSKALADAGVIEKNAELNLDDDGLKSITRLSLRMMELEDFIEALTTLSKNAHESLRVIREGFLPEAMSAADLKSIELENGSKLSVSMKYVGNIKKDNEDAALVWLKETKRSGVITPALTIPVAKGHLDQAEAIAKRLEGFGINYSLKPSVHWQTLRALVRELYESGEKIPDCITTYTINEAKIKRK